MAKRACQFCGVGTELTWRRGEGRTGVLAWARCRLTKKRPTCLKCIRSEIHGYMEQSSKNEQTRRQ